MTRQTLSVVEVAEVLGIGRTLAYELARKGELPVLRFGKRQVVPRAALEKLLGMQLGPEVFPPRGHREERRQ